MTAGGSTRTAELQGECNEFLDKKCSCVSLLISTDEADAIAADFIQESTLLTGEEAGHHQQTGGVVMDSLAAETDHLSLVQQRQDFKSVTSKQGRARSKGRNENEIDEMEADSGFAKREHGRLGSTASLVIRDLQISRQKLNEHFGVHDPIIVALDSKIQHFAAGNDPKSELLLELWNARDKLSDRLEADDPIIAVLDSKIHLARDDLDSSIDTQQGVKSKDRKRLSQRGGQHDLDHQERGSHRHNARNSDRGVDGQQTAMQHKREKAREDMRKNEHVDGQEKTMKGKQKDHVSDKQKVVQALEHKDAHEQHRRTNKHKQTKESAERGERRTFAKVDKRAAQKLGVKESAPSQDDTDHVSQKLEGHELTQKTDKAKVVKRAGSSKSSVSRSSAPGNSDDDVGHSHGAHVLTNKAEQTRKLMDEAQETEVVDRGYIQHQNNETEGDDIEKDFADLKSQKGSQQVEAEDGHKNMAKSAAHVWGADKATAKAEEAVKGDHGEKQNRLDKELHENVESKENKEKAGSWTEERGSQVREDSTSPRGSNEDDPKKVEQTMKWMDEVQEPEEEDKGDQHSQAKETTHGLQGKGDSESSKSPEEVEKQAVRSMIAALPIKQDRHLENMLGVLENAYFALDKDHSGYLDSEELRIVEPFFEKHDTDKDGKVSLQEYVQQNLIEQGLL